MLNMPFRNLLKTTPPDAVRSLDELFAIAHAMEQEAAERYGQLATRMQVEGNSELAALFERLASEEQSHEDSVVSWSRQRIGKAPDPSAIRWKLPKTFDEETAAELTSSRLINAYRVLSMAVRNEERAFTLWSYIAAQADEPEIQKAAERMAHEELEHVSLLRRARREAYHAERTERPSGASMPVDALLVLATSLEGRLADRLVQIAEGLAGDEADRSRELAADTRTIAAELAGLSAAFGTMPAAEDQDTAAMAERLVEIYLDIGDRSRDETLVARVQTLARQAIARLAWLRVTA
jgi:rubrerythrin